MSESEDQGVYQQMPPDAKDSQIFGVSVRAWLAVMLIGTVCLIFIGWSAIQIYVAFKTNTLPDLTVGEPLYSLTTTALGFYLGQKTKPN